MLAQAKKKRAPAGSSTAVWYLATAHGQLYGTAVDVVNAEDVVNVEDVIDAEDVVQRFLMQKSRSKMVSRKIKTHRVLNFYFLPVHSVNVLIVGTEELEPLEIFSGDDPLRFTYAAITHLSLIRHFITRIHSSVREL